MHLDQLVKLKEFDSDPSFLRSIQTVKNENKMKLAAYLEKESGITINCSSLFDIHVIIHASVTITPFRCVNAHCIL